MNEKFAFGDKIEHNTLRKFESEEVNSNSRSDQFLNQLANFQDEDMVQTRKVVTQTTTIQKQNGVGTETHEV